MTRLLLRGARIVGGSGDPVDLEIHEGRIRRVAPRIPPGTAEVIELEGRWVLPGLWDHHVHLEQWAIRRERVDVSGARSAAEAVAIARAAAERHPPPTGTVLVGFGFRDGLWPDRLSAESLDEVGAPTALISGDVHAVWCNHAALALFGLPAEAWLLREQPAFDLNRRLSEIAPESLDRWVAEAVRAAAARGVVGLVDLEMTDAGGAWVRRRADPAFPRMRIRAGVYPAHLGAARARGQRTGAALAETDGLVVGGSFKIFADGALNTRTAFTVDSYPGEQGSERHGPEAHGLAIHEPKELDALVAEARAAGLVPTIHAIGDAAVTRALDAFARAGIGGSIEHAQLVGEADLGRFARLGVTASVQPEHAMDDRRVAERYWPGRTGRAFAYRCLIDAGARLVLGSDAPVAPLDPWNAISAAVTRERDGEPPWHPEQRITLAQALTASTHSRVAEGEPADLVLLDDDPAAADAERLRAMPVAGTLLGGEWSHLGL